MEDVTPDCVTYKRLQARLPEMFERVFPDRLHPRTVLIVPSLTLDADVLSKISGAHHYEERMLCLLLLLRLPRTRVIYVTSEHISEAVIDYFLHLLAGRASPACAPAPHSLVVPRCVGSSVDPEDPRPAAPARTHRRSAGRQGARTHGLFQRVSAGTHTGGAARHSPLRLRSGIFCRSGPRAAAGSCFARPACRSPDGFENLGDEA